ncbi:MAG: hypothetical protein RI884_3142 [Pseudomonadota bacterium]|jgi:nephrocystin-3
MSSSRSVRIFLSSTFRDFGGERDLLVRRVFPALRAKLRERFVELVDVDLRWGITVQQAERGEVLPICLSEIDRARPFFIGMLGERYGWIPPPEGYAPDLVERQPWLKQHQGGKSVTELEILHGVLNNRRMHGRAFFYFRAPGYARTQGGDYVAASPEDRQRQSDLKRRIRASGYPVTGYRDPQALARRLEQDLWALLDAEFPASSVPDAFEREAMRHEAYAIPRRRLYLGGDRYQAVLEQSLTAGDARILVEGASGGGKSALMANFFAGWRQRHRRHVVHEHYLGASADAASPHALVRRLVERIQRTTGSQDPIADDPQALMESLPQWLAVASAWARKRRTRLVIVLDALNNLREQQDLRWWPDYLPQGITLVVSCLPGPVLQALQGRTPQGPGWRQITVKPLTAAERRDLLTTYLARYNKVLPRDLTAQALAHPLAGNPLFLRTLAEELRLFGVHEQLTDRLAHYLESQAIDDLFERVLARVEGDCGARAVRAAMTAIWASRAGLTEGEILALAGLVPATWAPIRNALDEALLEANGRITFAHDYLRVAVKDRYLPDLTSQRAAHRRLARWFASLPPQARRAEEEPWQWQQAQDWPRLRRCLSDQDMFLALRHTQGTQALLSYWIALETAQGLDTARACLGAWRRWSRRGSAREQAGTVAELARFLIDTGRIGAPTLALAQEAVRRLEVARGPRHAATLSARSALASLHTDAGRYEQALALQQDILALRRRRLGPDHPDTQSTLGNLALLLTYMGRHAQAQSVYDELLPSLRRTLATGASREDYLTAVNNQGLLHYYQDRHALAEPCFQDAWRQLRTLLGPDHPDNGDKINNLANLYFKQGRLDEAIALHRQCLALWQEGLGANNPRTASSCNNLGYILLTKGDFAGAEPLLDRAHAVYLQRLGERHPNTLSCANSLAIVYSQTDRKAQAIERFTRVLHARQEVLGVDHPQTQATQKRLNGLLAGPSAAGSVGS